MDGERRVDVYGYDLIWKLVDLQIEGTVPMPSDLWKNKHKVDRRTAKEIINDVLHVVEGIDGG